MGIPGFFISMSKNYNIAISKKISNADIFFDFNSLIYTAKAIVFSILSNYIRSKFNLPYDTKSDFSKIPSTSVLNKVCHNYKSSINQSDADSIISIRNQMLFECILNLVKNVIDQVETINSINIYLDGVPFIGKMIEQRKRALLSGLINRGKEIIVRNVKIDEITKFINITMEPLINLDKSAIKPGTNYMILLDNWLNNEFKNIITKHTHNNKLKWLFNGYTINGEAEHKIMDDLLNKAYDNILVYSPDADMIILLLPLTDKLKIYLVRDSTTNDVYSVLKLKEDIVEHIKKMIKSDLKLIDQRLVLDMAFIYNIFGNDFLPKLDNLNIYDKTIINRVIIQYVKYLESSTKNDIYLINQNNNINWYNYTQFLLWLNKEFKNPTIDKIYTQDTSKLKNNKFEDQVYSLFNYNKGFYKKQQDKYIWKNDFYQNTQFFDKESMNNIIKDYLIGNIMITLLYTKIYKEDLSSEEKQIVQLWYYSHHKAPLIEDIYNFLNKYINKDEFDNDKFKRDIREHIVHFLKNMTITEITPMKQLYYVNPLYDDFVNLMNPDKKLFPKLEEHKIYEEFLNQLHWDEKSQTLNINDLVDCNGQRYIEKCVPLLKSKLNNSFINLIFDIKKFI